MIFSKESGMQQVSNLLHLYDGLRIISMDEKQILLAGPVLIDRIARGYRLCKEYQIKIGIPLCSDELPYVIDDGNHIDSNYPHRYINGKLCLETDTAIRLRFVDGFMLDIWMSEYVETYFFSYEFYQRYGEYPFGEREHGYEGILQTYSDVFHEMDSIKTIKIMKSISTQDYRGHVPCPCGSGKRLRACHGPVIMNFYTDDRFKAIVQKDYLLLEEVVNEYDQQRNNSRKAK